MIIQISAGQGPCECQLAVAKLYEALKREYKDLTLLSSTKGAKKDFFDPPRFRTDKNLSHLGGRVLWI